MSDAGHLIQEFDSITEYFSPRIVAIANGQYVKLARFKGEFRFHARADEPNKSGRQSPSARVARNAGAIKRQIDIVRASTALDIETAFANAAQQNNEPERPRTAEID